MSRQGLGDRMRRRWGLQAKMTASYVLVTAAAVVLVEVVVAVIVLPGLVSRTDRTALVQLTASGYAKQATILAATLGGLPTAHDLRLGEPGLRLGPGQAEASADGTGVRIPYTAIPQDDAKPMSLALLLTPDGRVIASSYPARFKIGQPISRTAVVPTQFSAQPPTAWVKGGSQAPTSNGDVLWAAAWVRDPNRAGLDKPEEPPPASDLLGVVYVQVPAAAKLPGGPGLAGESASRALEPRLGAGLLVLVGAVPVGLVFGLLSTRRLIGRLRRLAGTTVAVAGGDYKQRVEVSGGDEVAQLEANFNRMAERLDAAMATQRQLAEAGERARIARELHDAISQDLFSLRLLAGGLRRALPADSPLHPQVQAMEQTATGTMHEMQALLLELRPVALAEAGLVPALEELCHAYRERLGITVDAELEPVELAPVAEHAVLRVVQEALANAVKHAQPTRIALRLAHHADGQVTLAVTDDGGGFDVAQATQRHGLGVGLMRERVAELGGTFQLDSTPGQGTSVRVLLPGSRP
jgi:signal transduction histidine kinase